MIRTLLLHYKKKNKHTFVINRKQKEKVVVTRRANLVNGSLINIWLHTHKRAWCWTIQCHLMGGSYLNPCEITLCLELLLRVLVLTLQNTQHHIFICICLWWKVVLRLSLTSNRISKRVYKGKIHKGKNYMYLP